MKSPRTTALIVLSVIVLFLGISSQRDRVASILWENAKPQMALTFISEDADLAMQIGNHYFGGNEYDLKKAKRAYSKAVATDSDISWGHYQLARIYFLQREFEEALLEINQELFHYPENFRALYVRGLIYAYDGNLPKAEEDFLQFTNWTPAEWAGYNDLAWVLMKRGEYEAASDVLQRAFKNVPDAEKNAWLWNNRGTVELNLGKLKEAKISFGTALELAEILTINDWQKSYPGNDPDSAKDGLEHFRNAILENLNRTAVHNLINDVPTIRYTEQ